MHIYVGFLKMIHISKTGSENDLNIRNKLLLPVLWELILKKTWVLTISVKYLHYYEINHSIKESSAIN